MPFWPERAAAVEQCVAQAPRSCQRREHGGDLMASSRAAQQHDCLMAWMWIDALKKRDERQRLAGAVRAWPMTSCPRGARDGVGLDGCRRYEALRLKGRWRGFEIEQGERRRPGG
jgi:hypothetical protein